MPTLAQQIRTARESAGMSRRELGIKLEIDGQTIYNWERGRHAPGLTMLKKIASATGHRYIAPQIVGKAAD